MNAGTSFLETPIEYLKGVGPQRAEALKKELSINTFSDLLHFYPFRYVDRTRFYKIKEVKEEMPYIQLCGKITRTEILGEKRRQRLVAELTDDTGTIELVWFQGIKWINKTLSPVTDYIVFGKPAIFNGKYNISHPSIEAGTEENKELLKGLQPVYSATELLKLKGLDSSGILRLQRTLVPQALKHLDETLPAWLIEKLHLLPRREAIRHIHLPANNEMLMQAQRRLKFEELFYLQINLLRHKVLREQAVKGYIFPRVGDHFNEFYNNNLPFPLTTAQKRVVKEIHRDMGTGKQMNRLLQGDVGSGKTLVALLSMLLAIDNGYQCCLMAPTEILAMQHYATLKEFLGNLSVEVDIITGSTKKSGRKKILEKLGAGVLQIIIGTHALVEDAVKFNKLGLVVIDEQHRFGVEQRARLWQKSEAVPHVLIMTATPIPRTLAMTFYGDLNVSVIDEMPPGRKPVKTVHRYDNRRSEVYAFIRKELQQGRQAYIIYPLIDESEKNDLENLVNGYEEVCKAFPMHRTAMIHGKIKLAEREKIMQLFAKNEIHILVATTIIEVGVNVPNAGVILIESAQRFGLSQLHQLRGRVGRSAYQSYCILMTPFKLGADARTRIDTIVRTGDGFEISEQDLRLRGPGDITGTQQSGILDLKISDIARDGVLVSQARIIAGEILNEDPGLTMDKNKIIAQQLFRMDREKGNWSRIS